MRIIETGRVVFISSFLFAADHKLMNTFPPSLSVIALASPLCTTFRKEVYNNFQAHKYFDT
jgi:hypothetical protein